MQEEISLKEIFEIIKNNIGKIVGMGVLFAVISALITIFVITPEYRSTTQILVNQSSDSTELNQSQIQTSVQLINTYSEIIVSDTIINETMEKMGEERFTADEIRDMINVTSNADSQIFSLNVTSEDPEYSAVLANTLTDTFGENIGDMFEVNNVSILTPAKVNPEPVSPNLILNVLIAGVTGLVVGLVIAFLREAMDTTVKGEEDLERLGLLSIGQISRLSQREIDENRYRNRRRQQRKSKVSFSKKDTGTVSKSRTGSSRRVD